MIDSIEARYRRQTPTSEALQRQASASLPGGDTRSITHHRPYPLVIERGDGPFLWDVDGNRYIDALYNYTSLVHGHAFPPVVRAVEARISEGFVWPAASRDQIELAELLVTRIRGVEQIRFCNSGTEAGMLAAQVARAATGRSLILKADGGYHGSYDDLATSPDGQVGPRTLVAPYGDASAFERYLSEAGPDIAAVFLEPVMGAGGIIEGSQEFLRAVQDAARRAGAVFVIDEVITFRLAVGGIQTKLALNPDLTMLGKVIGGGLPVGALGGSRDLMALFDPYKGPVVSHSGTFNGNSLTCVAGKVALEELTEERITIMNRQGASLASLLLGKAADCSLNLEIRCVGSLLNVTVSPGPTATQPEIEHATQLFHLASLTHGVFMAPRGMMALATVVSPELLAELGQRLGDALATVSESLHARV